MHARVRVLCTSRAEQPGCGNAFREFLSWRDLRDCGCGCGAEALCPGGVFCLRRCVCSPRRGSETQGWHGKEYRTIDLRGRAGFFLVSVERGLVCLVVLWVLVVLGFFWSGLVFG